MIKLFSNPKKDIVNLRRNLPWIISKEWTEAIADANDDKGKLQILYDCLIKVIVENPEAFELWWLEAVPDDVEAEFAELGSSDRPTLHTALLSYGSAEQEKTVKSIIRFWYKRSPDQVPDTHKEYAGIVDEPAPPVTVEFVPHGAIAEPVAPLPRVEAIIDKSSLQILLGVDTEKKPLYWTPNQETNGFALVIGASGSGKTESIKAIATEINNYGIPTLIIDFHGDITLDNSRTIALSHTAACEYGINPLELDSLDSMNGGVFPQIQKLIESIFAFNPSVGYKQKLCIERYLSLAYEKFGINDSDINSWSIAPPTFLDVINLMETAAEGNKDVASALGIVSSVFKHPVFSKPKRFDIESILNGSHRIDLSALTEDIQFLVVDTLLRKVGCALASKGHIPVKCSDRERYRFAVFMDEAHKFTSKSTNRKGIIDVYACELRKYGLMMCLGSQNLDHFSPDTISQVATKILLKLQSAESARFPANEFGLSIDTITKALRGKGHGYLKRGSAAPVEFQFTPIYKR
jgi:hypothetical protein